MSNSESCSVMQKNKYNYPGVRFHHRTDLKSINILTQYVESIFYNAHFNPVTEQNDNKL